MLARGILGSGRTRGVSFWPFPNSSGWRWLISSAFRISCHKTTHANGSYGAWPGWAVSISVLPLTLLPFRVTFYYLIYAQYRSSYYFSKGIVLDEQKLCNGKTKQNLSPNRDGNCVGDGGVLAQRRLEDRSKTRKHFCVGKVQQYVTPEKKRVQRRTISTRLRL